MRSGTWSGRCCRLSVVAGRVLLTIPGASSMECFTCYEPAVLGPEARLCEAHMHERYGMWNSVYVPLRRWAEQGLWDALLQTLVDPGLTDGWQHMIDSAAFAATSQRAEKAGSYECSWSITRRLHEQDLRPMRGRGRAKHTIKDCLSASSCPAARRPITPQPSRWWRSPSPQQRRCWRTTAEMVIASGKAWAH